jgi:hypothetical protein
MACVNTFSDSVKTLAALPDSPTVSGVIVNSNLSMLTLNLHGFNQSCDFLSDVCASGSYDVIFVEEHWLASSDLYKLATISPDYVLYGESAMNEATKKGVLYGRPWGGVAVMVKADLTRVTSCRLICERIVALTIAGSLFVNIYLPCEDSVDALDLVVDTLSSVACIINDFDYDYIFWVVILIRI